MEDLAQHLRLAVSVLKGYAEHDEKVGDVDDAYYTRQLVARMEKALAAQGQMHHNVVLMDGVR